MCIKPQTTHACKIQTLHQNTISLIPNQNYHLQLFYYECLKQLQSSPFGTRTKEGYWPLSLVKENSVHGILIHYSNCNWIILTIVVLGQVWQFPIKFLFSFIFFALMFGFKILRFLTYRILVIRDYLVL